MSHEYISLSDEIDSIEDYLKLEFLRFGDKFDYSLKSDQVLDLKKWEVYPGMVQPFIENAIWHGVRGLQYRKGIIGIKFVQNHNFLQCIVTDDGIGRKTSEKNKNAFGDRKSRGINLILERMQIINHLEKSNYSVVIEDLIPEKEECGTMVIIDIPARARYK
jgi:LytS/YehU family sensor histidine kinase